jgi:hypothetical protein
VPWPGPTSSRTAPRPRPGPARGPRAHPLLPDESEDHFLGLEQAQEVGTGTLLTTRDNIEAVIEAKAMMGCVSS